MSPKVSICIPTYEQTEYLKKTLDSIFMQSFKNYEVVISDDSKTDSVKTLVSKYQDNRIKYSKNNISLGTPSNWNNCIRLSSGIYIKIMHHDDWFTDEKSLDNFVRALDSNVDADFAFSATLVHNPQKNITKIHSLTHRQIRKISQNPTSLYSEICIGAPSSTIFKRKSNCFFDINLKWVVDIEFYIRVITKNKKIIYLDDPLICTPTGVSHQVTEICLGNKKIELFEWVYLFNKIKKKNITDIKYLMFISKNIVGRLKIYTIKEMKMESNINDIPWIFKLAIIINRNIYSKINQLKKILKQ